MKISEIYTKYQIPKHLQQHMYRVAAVGLVVADLLDESIEHNNDIITTTLLLHDIGNIMKFDFKSDLLKNENIENLKIVKKDFMLKYGNEEHEVTINITKELGVDYKVVEMLQNTGSSKTLSVINGNDWDKKICTYADVRVCPHGVASVTERFDEIIERYKGRDHELADVEKTEQKKANCLILEKQMQEKCSSSLSLIDDLTIAPIIEKLAEYEIK
jgi:hypothetical protein